MPVNFPGLPNCCPTMRELGRCTCLPEATERPTMTTPPKTREEWEKRLIGYGQQCTATILPVPTHLFDKYTREATQSLHSILDSIMSLQAEVETTKNRLESFRDIEKREQILMAEVERLRTNDVMRLFEVDRHNFSTRPCSTCAAISTVTKKDFGCTAMRNEKARQPK